MQCLQKIDVKVVDLFFLKSPGNPPLKFWRRLWVGRYYDIDKVASPRTPLLYFFPRGDSSSWGEVDLTSKVNHQYDHMFKTIVNTNKNTTSMHMASKIINSTSKGKQLPYPETRVWFWKGSSLSSNCEPFAWKMHVALKKLHRKLI